MRDSTPYCVTTIVIIESDGVIICKKKRGLG